MNKRPYNSRMEITKTERITSRETEEANASPELQQLVAKLESELDARFETIEALTAELTAREKQISAIQNSRAWRWICRYGRVKRGYLVPALSFFRGFIKNSDVDHKRHQDAHRSSSSSVTRPSNLGLEDGNVVLFPTPSPQSLPTSFRKEALTLVARPDVICFSIVDWDFRYQRPQQIVSQFAANGHRVFYIKLNEILPPHSDPSFSVSKIKENVYEVTLAAHRPTRINQEDLRGRNAGRLISSLEDLRHAFDIQEGIAYVMTPSWTTVAVESKKLWGWRIIYDCMDEWNGFPGTSRAITHPEKRLVKSCDLLVVTAQRLFDKWSYLGTPIVLARNAVDYDYYQRHCQPNCLLSGIDNPVVGYYGAIADWLDLDLMLYVARNRPHYTFVLLGGIFDVDTSELSALPNVRLLGQQPYETMPQYLFHFDACLIPFKSNHITASTDPVKVYEYLSGGKPVVSVALPELRDFSSLLYIAHDRDEFLTQLDRAVADKDLDQVELRRRFAAQNTWQHRYETITRALADTVPRASVIVVTYNNLSLNRLCLESILRNTQHLNYEIVVVDNASSDGTPNYLTDLGTRHSHIKVILNRENRGFAAANNQGLAISSGQHLVLLNNDTIVPPGWLRRLLSHLEDPAIGMVGPVTNFTGNEAKVEVDYKTLGEMELFAMDLMRSNDGRLADISMLAMFCVAFRRATYEQVGPLDEEFGIGMFEDDDYSVRIKKNNLRVVCAADVFVHHFGQAAFKDLIANGSYDSLFTENRRRFESKWNLKWIPHKNAALNFSSSAEITEDT